MVKVGCWNRWGSVTSSIRRVKGDLESWSSALLMVSQAPWRWASAFMPLVMLFHMRESLAWGGPWPLPTVVIVFVIEKCVQARGDCLRCARRNFLFKSFISRCMACSLSHLWDMWLPTREWLLLVWVVFTLPSRNLPFFSFRPCSGFGNYPAGGIWLAWADESLPYRGLILPCSIVVLTSTQVLPTDSANCRVHFWEVLYCWRKWA